jgi:hypothetical protein
MVYYLQQKPNVKRRNRHLTKAGVFIYFQNNYYLVMILSDLMYYKGLYRVKVVTESEGYWIVEAQENFEDTVDGEKIAVRTGERRIVKPCELDKKKVLSPPIPEHLYERKLEQKIKQMVEEYDNKE